MHCDMLKIQDGGAIVEKVNCNNLCTDKRYIVCRRTVNITLVNC